MSLPSNPYVLPALLSAIIAALIAVFVWSRRPAPGARYFALVSAAGMVWCLAYSFELASPDLSGRIFWSKVAYFGILGTTLVWLAFALEYTGHERFVTRRNFTLLAIFPAITLALVWTNEYHGLIWSRFELDTSLGFVMSRPTRNIAFWVQFSCNYILLLTSSLLFLQHVLRSPLLYRKQATALVIASMAPWAGNAITLSGYSPFPRLDLTPLSFSLAGAVVAWGMYRHRLLDIIPIARDKLIENLQDAIVVLDPQNRIVDANPAAETILGRRLENIIGKSSAKAGSVFANLAQQYAQVSEARTEVAFGEGESAWYYDLRITSFRIQRRKESVGRLWVFRDISERKRSEQRLAQLAESLEKELAHRRQAEDALVRLNDDLERRVTERTTELTRVNAELLTEIAERTRVAEALSASEERYRAVIENQTDMVYRRLADGTLTFVNEALCRALGKSSKELLGMNLLAFVTKEEADQAQRSAAAASPQNPSWTFEQRLEREGEVRWVHWKGRAIFGAQDQLIEIQSVGREITELKRAEEGTRLQAARANALASTAARLNSRLDLSKVLDAVCEETARAMNAPAVAVFLHDSERAVLYPAALTGLPHKSTTDLTRIPLKEYSRYSQKLGSIIAINDVQAEPRFPNAPVLVETGIRTIASASMLRDGRLLGVLMPMLLEVREYGENELTLLKALADQAALAISNARLFEDTERSLQYVQSLREIDLAIAGSVDLRIPLRVLLDQVKKQLEIDAAQVLLYNPQQQSLNYAMGIGFNSNAFQHTRLRIGDGYAGKAALEQRTVEVSDLVHEQNGRIRAPLVGQERFVYYRATPLVSKGEVRGVLEIFHRSRLFPSIEWQQILQGLATEAAIAIDNATLFDKLQQSNAELGEAYDSTIEGWARTLDMRDHEVKGHTQRVTELAVELGRELGMKPDELVNLRRGALLHDIGKMCISDSILLKPGRHTDAEVAEMRKHPAIAYELLSPIEHLRYAIDIPYCHHEKWDGSGYPRGLKGEEIPLAARAFTVVDVWDALRSSRPYRKPLSEERTKAYIREHAGKLFDPAVVSAFMKVLGA